MYSVVGCSDCDALWVVADRPETTECPRCGTRHRFASLKAFVETEDPDGAREARAAMLADRQGEREAFDALDDFESLADDAAADAVPAETYLSERGLDPEEVAAAGERASSGAGSGGQSQGETVRAALRELDAPTRADVVDYATERGVPADSAEETLAKLRRSGEVTEAGGTYRLL